MNFMGAQEFQYIGLDNVSVRETRLFQSAGASIDGLDWKWSIVMAVGCVLAEPRAVNTG